jgi:hypothetical protein
MKLEWKGRTGELFDWYPWNGGIIEIAQLVMRRSKDFQNGNGQYI